MEGESLLYILVFVIAYGAVSKRLEASVITPAMCFVAFGMLMGSHGLGLLGLDAEQPVGLGIGQHLGDLVDKGRVARARCHVWSSPWFAVEGVDHGDP